jgi:Fe-S-cluster-containing hydrogenase component 2
MKKSLFHPQPQTKYIRLSPHACRACWECIKVCPEGVLVKIDLPFHAHVHIRNAEACRGCKKCVRVCEYDALAYTFMPGAPVSARANKNGIDGKEQRLC